MWGCEDYILAYIRQIYGAKILYRNHLVYIKTEDDIYRIDFHLAKENIYRFISVTKPLVLTDTIFSRGCFRVAAHASYKKANKIPSNADWKKFLKDAYKHEILMEDSNG